jgi:hypothetical protein
MARLALGEALTNLCMARASSLEDVRASVNWMYAAKMKSEGVAMYDAAEALRWAQCWAAGLHIIWHAWVGVVANAAGAAKWSGDCIKHAHVHGGGARMRITSASSATE